MAELTLAGLCKGWDFPVIDRLDLTVEEGEFFVIVGPSGIGKTTLLRLVAGLETPDAGTVTVGERDITPLPPYHRNVAMTFESYALYPHLSVFENIASPLRARKTTQKRVTERVHSVARLLQIEALLERRPGEISGGQKQRTALGRTLVADPEVFLLDEPLSHLDAKIRHELREEFHTLEALRAVATLYVTHDYAEALSLGDRVGVMGNGSLVQVGTARELFQQPQHIFVARQLGQPSINTVGATLIDQAGKVGLQADATTVRIELEERDGQRLGSNGHEHVTVGIRPQHLRVLNEGENPASHQQLLEARVEIFEALGAEGILVADVDGLQLTALTSPELAFAYGENVRLGLDTRALHFFDSTSGMRL